MEEIQPTTSLVPTSETVFFNETNISINHLKNKNMKTKKRIIFESKVLKIKVYLNKRDKLEMLLKSKNLESWKDRETEFSEIIIKPRGIEIMLSTGKKMIFLFSSLTLFVSPTGDIEFDKEFPWEVEKLEKEVVH